MKSFVDFSENLEDRKKQLMQKQKMMQQMEKEKASRTNQQFKQDLEDKQSRVEKEKEEAKKREQLKKEIKDEIKDEMKDNVEEELNQDDKPFVKKLVGKLRKGSKTHAKQADDLEKAMTEESNPRIPRKKGQPAGSKKHSDLYTDERSGILLDHMLIKFKQQLLWNKEQEKWVKPLKQQSTESSSTQ